MDNVGEEEPRGHRYGLVQVDLDDAVGERKVQNRAVFDMSEYYPEELERARFCSAFLREFTKQMSRDTVLADATYRRYRLDRGDDEVHSIPFLDRYYRTYVPSRTVFIIQSHP